MDIEKGTVLKNEEGWLALEKFLLKKKPSKIFILADENTNMLCTPLFKNKLKIKIQFEVLTIPTGEKYKNIDSCLTIWEKLSEKNADRNSLIINLGGGMITDIGGFIASTFKRGIEFLNIPTSLLAMVDASVGGKNGVDLGPVKNQIGVINNPLFVLVEMDFLKTLPKEQLLSGWVEMLKHGLIYSEKYWNEMQSLNFENNEALENGIWESIRIKKEIVQKDPFEKNERKTLNYGHTLGHAIEAYFLENAEKSTLLHGEAIAIGIILATYISHKELNFPKDKLNEIAHHFQSYFPKQSFFEEDIAKILKFLIFDKKNQNGKVLFVLLKDIGNYRTDCVVPNSTIFKAFDFYKNF
ncbi:3-dehydroquinate synthase [Aequorivita echinoideorum]|uniref:3-dehydroquinate synthase n=1 Tax=Aequorivita echinoideorum TaxID=1549647 RepID=A0ABS5SA75_9FLAO|nr:3-dehydroquinate synthase [Aequorivita echinoideorum]MBT0608755.1 3-dehydroquinate synthase [Aequorivita echinoideorum]